MKLLIFIFAIQFTIPISDTKIKINIRCDDAYSSADDAYTYCKKAYNSEEPDETKSYLKKAMGAFEDCMSNSDDCHCDDAKSAADDGYRHAKKGYNSDDWEEVKGYAKKAKSEAEDAMSAAEDCHNK